jgi:uncharacterized membrane protein YGL010W
MRSINEFLNEYGKTHRNSSNQRIHFLCVPVILISTLAFGWPLSLAMLGNDAAWATFVNVTTIASALMLVGFYARLGWRAVVAMAVFLAVSIAVIMAVESSVLPLIWTAVIAWVAAWVLQLVGHNIEGAKPSFVDDVVFLLIGPLFVLEEWGVPLRTK